MRPTSKTETSLSPNANNCDSKWIMKVRKGEQIRVTILQRKKSLKNNFWVQGVNTLCMVLIHPMLCFLCDWRTPENPQESHSFSENIQNSTQIVNQAQDGIQTQELWSQCTPLCFPCLIDQLYFNVKITLNENGNKQQNTEFGFKPLK